MKFKNSWQMVVPDLKDKNRLEYHYICRCGNVDITTNTTNSCTNCANIYYHNLSKITSIQKVEYLQEFFLDYELTENQNLSKVDFFYLSPVLTEKKKLYAEKKHLVYSLTFTRPDKMDEKIYDEYLCRSICKNTNQTIHSMIKNEIVKILDLQELIVKKKVVSFNSKTKTIY